MVLVAEAHAAIERRRVYNSKCTDWNCWRVDVHGIWMDMWKAVERHIRYSHRKEVGGKKGSESYTQRRNSMKMGQWLIGKGNG